MHILRFTAEWCGPCKKMKPVLDKIVGEHPDVTILVRDIETEFGRAAAEMYDVTGVPTLIKIDADGNETARLVGAHPKGKVEKHFEIA
jgi:thioredoxin 1